MLLMDQQQQLFPQHLYSCTSEASTERERERERERGGVPRAAHRRQNNAQTSSHRTRAAVAA
jgi:hypothetical protein